MHVNFFLKLLEIIREIENESKNDYLTNEIYDYFFF